MIIIGIKQCQIDKKKEFFMSILPDPGSMIHTAILVHSLFLYECKRKEKAHEIWRI